LPISDTSAIFISNPSPPGKGSRPPASLHPSTPGECPDGGPSHASPVATDPLKFELCDAAVRQEIPVLAKRLRLAGQDGLLHVLGGLARKCRIPGADPLQVMTVRAADLREMKS